MAAVNGNLDLVGIMTLAFCTALGGGIIRDTLLGALPPAALRDWRYPAIALDGGGAGFRAKWLRASDSYPCASGLGRRRPGNLRNRGNREGHHSQNESAGRGPAGHDYGRRRRDCTGHSPHPGSQCVALGSLCNRRSFRLRGHDSCHQNTRPREFGRRSWRSRLLPAASHQPVAALERAESPRTLNVPFRSLTLRIPASLALVRLHRVKLLRHEG